MTARALGTPDLMRAQESPRLMGTHEPGLPYTAPLTQTSLNGAGIAWSSRLGNWPGLQLPQLGQRGQGPFRELYALSWEPTPTNWTSPPPHDRSLTKTIKTSGMCFEIIWGQ